MSKPNPTYRRLERIQRSQCPFCRSKSYEYDAPEVLDMQVWQYAHCKDCERGWKITYVPSDVSEYGRFK